MRRVSPYNLSVWISRKIRSKNLPSTPAWGRMHTSTWTPEREGHLTLWFGQALPTCHLDSQCMIQRLTGRKLPPALEASDLLGPHCQHKLFKLLSTHLSVLTCLPSSDIHLSSPVIWSSALLSTWSCPSPLQPPVPVWLESAAQLKLVT